MPFEVHSKIK